MKNIRVITAIFLIALTLLLLVSCGADLNTPMDFSVDADNKLSWSAVDSARTYTIEITPIDGGTVISKTTRKTSFSLSDLDVGDYEIRVMATGGAKNDLTSRWSSPFSFHRDYESGCVYELINNNTEYQVKKAGTATDTVLIESTYRGKPVTAIAEKAFNGNRNIVEVILGDNIQTIGANAFYNCAKLQKVVLPDSLTSIGESAFQGCRALSEINIPAGITEIPAFCFAYCRSLTSIDLGENILVIGDSAFNGAALPEVVIPNGVLAVGEYAFSSMADLKSITIGSGVLMLGAHALYDNPALESVKFAPDSSLKILDEYCFAGNRLLTDISLPDTLQDIGSFCFYQCESLDGLSIPDSVTHVGRAAFNGTKTYMETEEDFIYAGKWLVAVTNLGSFTKIEKNMFHSDTVGICDYCFYNAPELESVVLPDSVAIIGKFCFAYGPKLWKCETGSGLRKIQASAFAYCKVLTRALMKKGLEDIGDYVFTGCALLDNNALEGSSLVPDTVTHVGMYAFYGTKLSSAADDLGIIYAGKWVVGFDESKAPTAVILKQGMTGVADCAFYGCDTLQSLQYLSDCKYIGKGAFYNCSSLAAVTLNTNLRRIEPSTFYKCVSLYQVSFPRQLTTIGNKAFYKCELLESLDFTSARNFESIDSYAFYGCKNLKSIQFGEKITSIGEYAFNNCVSLESLVIPGSVKTIESHTFNKCSALTDLTIGNGVTSIEDYAFAKCASLSGIVIPDSVTKIGNNAFYSCTAVESLLIGCQVASIGDYAFYNLKVLAELRIPENVKSIGKYAFKGCEVLNTVIIPDTLTTISMNAFYGCKNATFYLTGTHDGEGWNARWNSSNRPVVRGVALSEDGGYIVSLTVGDAVTSNLDKLSDTIVGIHDPERYGFAFTGWLSVDGTVYTTKDLTTLPADTVLTAVWNVAEIEPEEPSPDEPASEDVPAEN